jgi:hypothetical protein
LIPIAYGVDVAGNYRRGRKSTRPGWIWPGWSRRAERALVMAALKVWFWGKVLAETRISPFLGDRLSLKLTDIVDIWGL